MSGKLSYNIVVVSVDVVKQRVDLGDTDWAIVTKMIIREKSEVICWTPSLSSRQQSVQAAIMY